MQRHTGTNWDRQGHTGTDRESRDRQGQTGTDRDRQRQTGRTRTDRGRHGQAGTSRDRRGLSLFVPACSYLSLFVPSLSLLIPALSLALTDIISKQSQSFLEASPIPPNTPPPTVKQFRGQVVRSSWKVYSIAFVLIWETSFWVVIWCLHITCHTKPIMQCTPHITYSTENNLSSSFLLIIFFTPGRA